MRIGIFTDVLAHPPSGIGWHVIYLLNHLAQLDPRNEYYLFHRAGGETVDPGTHCPTADNFHNVPIRTPDIFYRQYFRVFDRFLLPRAIQKHRIDLFHGPNHYLPVHRRAPQIVTYHDLAEMKFDLGNPAQQQAERQRVERTLARADRVIVVSHCTERDVMSAGYQRERVKVIYQGANFDRIEPPSPQLVERTRRRFELIGPYVLFIGSFVPRKNISMLVRSMHKLRERLFDDCPRLVLGGANDTEEFERIRVLASHLNIDGAITYTGYLSQEEARGLYGGATLYVMPSLYEGFGMPVLEAMAYRVPVISTRGGALAEVVDDAGVIVEDDDDEAMAAGMARVLLDPKLAAQLVERGVRRVRQFSWQRCAEQTLSLYEEVVAESRR